MTKHVLRLLVFLFKDLISLLLIRLLYLSDCSIFLSVCLTDRKIEQDRDSQTDRKTERERPTLYRIIRMMMKTSTEATIMPPMMMIMVPPRNWDCMK